MKSCRHYIIIVLILFPVTAFVQSPTLYSGRSVVASRFTPPEGYERKVAAKNSFTSFLRGLPLLPSSEPVRYYTGKVRYIDESCKHAGVIDIEIGKKNFQQSIQSLMRIWAEYLFEQQFFSSIHFHIRDSKKVPIYYSEWARGQTIIVDGQAYWTKSVYDIQQYRTFRHYLDFIFKYSDFNTIRQDIEPVMAGQLEPGDIIIRHDEAAIVLDVAINKRNNEKIVLLASGGSPAQSIRILTNTMQKNEFGAWFQVSSQGIITDEAVFLPSDFYRFQR